MTKFSGLLQQIAAKMVEMEQQHPEMKAVVEQVQAAGVPFITILVTALPYLLPLLSGGTVNVPALIAAIAALLAHPAPAA